jgi:hypothetical protein
MKRRDFASAYACAAEADRLLDRALEQLSQALVPDLPAGTSPIPIDWSTLSEVVRISQLLAQSRSAPQLIPGGEFENLDELMGSDWQRLENPPPRVRTAVRLSPEAPARGAYCLELEARGESPDAAPPAIALPPVWVTSPPLAAPPGHLIEITGLARVGEPPIGSPDPLLIFDSVGGEESALRIGAAPSWQPFRLVRAAPPGAEVRLTIALGGLGRVQVDSIAVRYVPLPARAVAQGPP